MARLFENTVPAPLNTFAISDNIDDLRDMIRVAGFNFCVPRDPRDHPVIVETWFRINKKEERNDTFNQKLLCSAQ